MGNIPNFAAFEFLAADVFNAAMAAVSGSIALETASTLKPGIVNGEVAGYNISGMNLTTSLPSPFTIVFGTGVASRAHGTVTNADTQTYVNNFASLVPASGSVLAYLSASYVQIQQSPRQVVGPPAGHPDYNPGFISYTMYQQNVDSIALTATLTPPDNISTFEISRFTLTPGMVTLPAVSTFVQQRASSIGAIAITGGFAGVVNPIPVSWAGTDIRVNGAATLTLPPVSGATGLVFNFHSITSGLVTINSADPIFGWSGIPGTSVNSFSLPNGAYVSIECTRLQWNIRAGSLLGINGLPANGVTATSGLFAVSSVGAVVLGISANGVTNPRLAQMANATLKGNMSGVLANPSDLAIANTATVSWTGFPNLSLAVNADSITNALLANVGAFTIKGNPTAGVVNPVDIVLQQTGTILITLGSNFINWSINADSVSNALLANMPALTIKANASGGAANPQDISVPALRNMLGFRSFGQSFGISSGGQFTLQHNVGILPNIVNVYLVCQSAEQGFPVGALIPVTTFTMTDQAGSQSALNSGVTLYHNSALTAIQGQFGSAGDVFAAPSRASGPGNTQGLTNGRWILAINCYWLGI